MQLIIISVTSIEDDTHLVFSAALQLASGMYSSSGKLLTKKSL